jgi:hypothetical protein
MIFYILRAKSMWISKNIQRESNISLRRDVATRKRTSPTISTNPFVPLSMNVDGVETQDSDLLIGREGGPIILSKVPSLLGRQRIKLSTSCYAG